ncbi:MAG: SusC/RagA family TonB-linked outer membrane protein [Chitinophagales bacterium]|nr:SusC/RagA family TonB-linked outer membrane protein [Chitinophagales bacterium]
MSKTLRFLMLILAVITWHVSYAQTRTITGTVKDNKGEPVIGASVIVKGTSQGTYTDVDGNYNITVPANSNILVFKYLGYKNNEMVIGSTNAVNSTLQEDVLGLDEVVVTALGISRQKKALAYATQEIGSDQLGNTGSGNVLHDLNGKAAGLTVINSNGDPGSGTYIRLRGVTSLTGNNQPLIIVDGIPIDNSINNYDPTGAGFQASGAAGNTTGGTSPSNRATDINPDDIASVTVLKGPAATALYGIQAASGALVITTKRGGQGAHKGANISFTSSFGINKVNRLPPLQNQYTQGSKGIYAGPDKTGLGGIILSSSVAAGRRTTWGPKIDTLSWDGMPYLYDVNGRVVSSSDPTAAYKVTPYDNEHNFFVDGTSLDNNLAVSGGNDKSGYRVSIGNNHQTGVVPKTFADKTTLSLNGQASVINKLNVSGGVTYIRSRDNKAQQGSNVSGIMLGLLRTPPTFDNAMGSLDPANDPRSYLLPNANGDIAFPNGQQRDYRGGPGYDNPYWTVNRNIFNEDLNRVYGFGQVDYNAFSWASLTYRIGGDAYSQSNRNGYDIQSNSFPEGSLFQDDYFNQQYNSDLILNLHKDFSDKFNASLILGHNYFVTISSEHWAQGDGFVFQNFFDMSNASTYLAHRADTRKKTMAFYGDLNLGIADQLFIELTGRNEVSSTLPGKNNNFFFPSANIGWVFTDALGLSTSETFGYGKLRASAARVGKDPLPFSLQTYYTSATIFDGFTSGITFPFNSIPGYQLANGTNVIGNPNLKPEFTNSYEGGLDLSFFKNRLSFNGTYYYSKTTGQIFTVPIAPSTGFAAALLNAGEIRNQGVELTLGITPVKTKGGFQWDLTFNWSTNKSKVVSLATGVDNLFLGGFQNGAVYAVVGKPYGQIFGPAFVKSTDGQLIIDDNPENAGFGYGDPIPGSQNTVLGDVNPDWIGSGISSFSFKGFALSFQVDIRQGGDVWNGTRGALDYFGTGAETANRGTTTVFQGLLGHLDATGNVVHFAADGSEVAGPGGANTTTTTLDQFYWQNIGSSFIGPAEPSVEDGSYVKLREVSIGYALPSKMTSTIGLSSLSFALFGSNFILHTDYQGVDPETSLVGPANGQGLDYFNNPGVKTFGVRLNLGL